MAKITESQAGGANVLRFLDLIAFSEDTYRIGSQAGYDVIVTGIDMKPETFSDFSDHPFAKGRKSKKINSKGLTSNASGRYQFMLKDWAHYRDQLKLPDFGPLSQDRWAIQLIRERRALDDIKAGRIAEAIAKCSNIWASFPGNNYGQNPHKVEKLLAQWQKLGGVLA